MLQGKVHLIWPLLHKRHHKDHCKNGKNGQQDQRGTHCADPVPHRAFLQLDLRDLAVAHIETLQIFQQRDTEYRRDQHHHCHHSTSVKVRDASQHLIVQDCRHHIVFSAYRRRNTVIRKAKEEALYKRGCQGSQKRTDNGLPKGLHRAVSHNPGHHQEFLINKSHGIQDQHKGNRQRIDHITEQQPVKPVNFKKLSPEKLSEQPLLAKGIDNGKSISNSRQQHRKDCQHLYDRLKFLT